jgi:uncharacterized protein with PQ loop repeat
MDTATESVITTIINEDPKPSCSIRIDFSPEEADINIRDIFDFLLIFLTQLCKKLYQHDTDKIALDALTTAHITYINKYFNSIGYSLIIDRIPYTWSIVDPLQKNRYDRITIMPTTRLSTLYMPVLSRDTIYIIQFAYLAHTDFH